MIEFESVGEYPNGYSITNDELAAIYLAASKDWSRNYQVKECWEMIHAVAPGARWQRVYHLEMRAIDDEGKTVGPVYRIEPDGSTYEREEG